MKKVNHIGSLGRVALGAVAMLLYGCVCGVITQKPLSGACGSITDKTSCLKNDSCLYDSLNDQCRDAKAEEAHTCAAIKNSAICNGHRQSSDNKKCEWDETKTPSCVASVLPRLLEEAKPTKKIEAGPSANQYAYYLLTFKHNALAMGKSRDAGVAIAAIGRSQDGSLLYFSTNSQPGRIYSLYTDALSDRANEVTIAPRGMEKETISEDIGIGGHPHYIDKIRGEVASNAFVTTIVAGPGKTAILAVANNIDNSSAIVQMQEQKPLTAWPFNIKISALGVIEDNWVAFVSKDKTMGMHALIRSEGAPALEGPRGSGGKALDDIITAVSVTNKADKIYIANNKDQVAFWDGKLDGNLSFAAANLIASQEDLQYDPKGPVNLGIKALAVVGDYLLIGIYGPPGYVNTGGVAIIDLKDPLNKKNPHPEQQGCNVLHIGISDDGQSAMISTTGGLMFFHDGKLFLISTKTLPHLKIADVTPEKPLAFSNIQLPIDPHEVRGAVFIRDKWYLGTRAGIFEVEVALDYKDR